MRLIIYMLSVLAIGGCYVDNEEELYGCTVNATDVKYSSTITTLLSANGCIGCHSGTAPSGGINLSTHAAVKMVADNGKLYGAINHSPGYVPMPQGGGKLPACDIKKIKAWIDAGAPNN